MSFLDGIEKLINEHASAAVLGERLAFAKDEFSSLEKQVSKLQIEVGKLEAKLEREQVDHDKAKRELQSLKDEHFEDVLIHSGLEFRKGKRTSDEWTAFCPHCHGPAHFPIGWTQCSNPKCKWMLKITQGDVQKVINSFANKSRIESGEHPL